MNPFAWLSKKITHWLVCEHEVVGINKSGDVTNIKNRLMLRMLNEAQACLREGVIPNSELLDAGVIFGTGFAPFRGGPMHYIDNQGTDALLDKMRQLHESYGERFNPDENWMNKS